MIERYSRPQMAAIWSLEAQYRTWLDVEILACEAWAKLGRVPAKALEEIKTKATFNTKNIEETEKKTRHDVAAFVSEVQKSVGDSGRFIHLGLTSSDILDTSFSYRLKKSAELLTKELGELLALTKDRANRDKKIPMVGRTHGIHAEPITFGMKWLYWHDLLRRAKRRMETAAKEVAVGKLSGAVGTYSHAPPEIESYVCGALGLRVDSFSTQVISRDRYAAYFSALALLGSCIETIATELRHLQRTEVGEVREGFAKGQKGSSAMPHKRNPISSENLTGLSRLLRGMLIPALEDCALWHERDISHSSVERVIGPDANIMSDYMLGRLKEVLENLEVFPERMKANLDSQNGVIFSQKALTALIEKGMKRDEAYEIIQKNSLAALEQNTPLIDLLKRDEKVTKALPRESLDVLFDVTGFFQHLDYLYKKALSNDV